MPYWKFIIYFITVPNFNIFYYLEFLFIFQVIRKQDSNNTYKSKARDYESAHRDSPASTQPKYTDVSPAKAALRPPTHELNTTYKVSRENSIPIAAKSSEELEPFVVDGAGEWLD